LAYTLNDAVNSLSEYKGLHETAWLLAMMKLNNAALEGPRKLRSEATRLRDAFYIYAEGVNYGRP
jgi:hypothetical protein